MGTLRAGERVCVREALEKQESRAVPTPDASAQVIPLEKADKEGSYGFAQAARPRAAGRKCEGGAACM